MAEKTLYISVGKIISPKAHEPLAHKRKWIVLSFTIALFVTSLAVIPLLGTEFIPELDEEAILIQPIRLPSISLTESIEMEKKVQK